MTAQNSVSKVIDVGDDLSEVRLQRVVCAALDARVDVLDAADAEGTGDIARV